MELRHAIEGYYGNMSTVVTEKEIFVFSGACDDFGDILELFDQENTVMVIEPAYPEYVDTNILEGRKIWSLFPMFLTYLKIQFSQSDE